MDVGVGLIGGRSGEGLRGSTFGLLVDDYKMGVTFCCRIELF